MSTRRGPEEKAAEISRLDEEYRHAQQTIRDLVTKLERAQEELRSREADKDMLTARLKEAEAANSNMARIREEAKMRIMELERQLHRNQHLSSDVMRRIGIAEHGHRQLVAEWQHMNQQRDVLQKKLTKLPMSDARRGEVQARHADPVAVPVAVPPCWWRRSGDRCRAAGGCGSGRAASGSRRSECKGCELPTTSVSDSAVEQASPGRSRRQPHRHEWPNDPAS